MAGRSERVALLADAAIALLAEHGARGLTHRAVDARAGLPLGTTSAYLRTRRALLEAVIRRLVELDLADLAERQLPTGELARPTTPLGPADLDALAHATGAVLDHWLSVGRDRTLARYACLLEASYAPELRPVLSFGIRLRTEARELLARAGAPDPDRRGAQLVAFVDGLLFDRLVGSGSLSAPPPGSAESRADLTDAVRTLLHAMLTPTAPGG
ncbi:TetR/AcrR family transcriptional regulator [Plantactinospora siamensis]|uniref:TetR/AcrR family transcriptional regulator n=1 Tax=Plantactinospora siamensis TaxID=555372 RepID=A0ABV6NXG7_9ACTN